MICSWRENDDININNWQNKLTKFVFIFKQEKIDIISKIAINYMI